MLDNIKTHCAIPCFVIFILCLFVPGHEIILFLFYFILAFSLFCLFVFGNFYLFPFVESSWVTQRDFVHSYITDETQQWILDSFLAPHKIYIEFVRMRLEWDDGILGRLTMYFLAAVCRKITLPMMTFYLLAFYGQVFYRAFKYLSHPYRTKFPFEKLPLTIQERFFELQTPQTRLNFTKAFPKLSLMPLYKTLHVDQLSIGDWTCGLRFFELYRSLRNFYNWPPRQGINLESGISIFMQFFQTNENVKLAVVNTLDVSQCSSEEIEQIFDFVNLFQIIWSTELDSEIFDIIKKLKLKILRLSDIYNDGSSFFEKAKEVLEAAIGIPEIYFDYEGEIVENEDNFEVFLVDWVLLHGYFKAISLKNYGASINDRLEFKS